jgi:hypothetical protein
MRKVVQYCPRLNLEYLNRELSAEKGQAKHAVEAWAAWKPLTSHYDVR